MGGVRSIAAVSSVFAACVTTERLVCLAVRSIILSVNVQTWFVLLWDPLYCLWMPGLSCFEVHTVCECMLLWNAWFVLLWDPYCLYRRAVSRDRRAEPLVGQRVPYVIVYGTPGLPLIQLVRCPRDLLADQSLRVNSTYYITKQILPPLHRVFSLLGVDVMRWYSDLPRVTRSV